MKKSLIALAVLGGFSGTVAAQSQVTLFGVVNLSATYLKNDGFGNRKSLSSSGIAGSRIGFRGVEDLGGGLRAGFWIEGIMTPDDGTAGGQTWTRRSTVSLLGGFGEVRLGRDYTPTFWNYFSFDSFGAFGWGASINVARFFVANGPNTSGQTTFLRSSNSIGYFLPNNLGGIYGQAMVAAGEGAAGKYVGGRIGFARGPFDVAAAYGMQDQDASGSAEYKTFNVGASWNLGFATLMTHFSQEKSELGVVGKERRWVVGAVVPVGQSELRASYVRSDATGGSAAFNSADANQIALGYLYHLSKRTALFAIATHIDNKSGAGFSVITGSSSPGGPTAGGKSNGLAAGIRHFF